MTALSNIIEYRMQLQKQLTCIEEFNVTASTTPKNILMIKPQDFQNFAEFETARIADATETARKVAAAEWQSSEKTRRLSTLHTEVGLSSIVALISALKAISGAARAEKTQGVKKERRKRTTITDEVRASVKAAAASGKKAPTIAKEFGLSTPTVYNILKS